MVRCELCKITTLIFTTVIVMQLSNITEWQAPDHCQLRYETSKKRGSYIQNHDKPICQQIKQT